MSCGVVGPERPTMWIAYHKTGWVNSMDLISFFNESYIAGVNVKGGKPYFDRTQRDTSGSLNNSTGAPWKRFFPNVGSGHSDGVCDSIPPSKLKPFCDSFYYASVVKCAHPMSPPRRLVHWTRDPFALVISSFNYHFNGGGHTGLEAWTSSPVILSSPCGVEQSKLEFLAGQAGQSVEGLRAVNKLCYSILRQNYSTSYQTMLRLPHPLGLRLETARQLASTLTVAGGADTLRMVANVRSGEVSSALSLAPA